MTLTTASARSHLTDADHLVDDMRDFTVYAADAVRVGRVTDLIVDGRGLARHLCVALEDGRAILVPAGCISTHHERERVDIHWLPSTRLDAIPSWSIAADGPKVDREYEVQVLAAFRAAGAPLSDLPPPVASPEHSAPIEPPREGSHDASEVSVEPPRRFRRAAWVVTLLVLLGSLAAYALVAGGDDGHSRWTPVPELLSPHTASNAPSSRV